MKLSLAAGLAVYVSLVNAFKGKMTHYTVRTHLLYLVYPLSPETITSYIPFIPSSSSLTHIDPSHSQD